MSSTIPSEDTYLLGTFEGTTLLLDIQTCHVEDLKILLKYVLQFSSFSLHNIYYLSIHVAVYTPAILL